MLLSMNNLRGNRSKKKLELLCLIVIYIFLKQDSFKCDIFMQEFVLKRKREFAFPPAVLSLSTLGHCRKEEQEVMEGLLGSMEPV